MLNYFSNIRKIEETVKKGEGFDWIIVVSSNKEQAKFWQSRLNRFKGKITGKNTRIISQYEDWPGGAGQLLGTLYAFQKANPGNRLGKALRQGKGVAIYHTAGKGKRMAPLFFSERGNKSAIKLPKILDGEELSTILDAVIFQTQVFAQTRPGRLCVFWGDQIIIPSENFDFDGECHAEIFGIKKEIPAKSNIWETEWQHYGILALDGRMEFLQREKVSWKDFKKLKKALNFKKLSKSLGFFSLSYPFLDALLEEFKFELKKKIGKLDTDFHLWTPLTSSLKEFLNRGGNQKYWERINRFKKEFLKGKSAVSLIKDKNLGEDTFWWDFGRLPLYHKNLLKVLEDTREGKVMREFFGLKKLRNSILINSEVGGEIKDSFIINTKAKNLKVEKALIINSNIYKLKGKNILVYNLKDSKSLDLNFGEVLSDVVLKNKKAVRMKTKINWDGKRDWAKKILGNHYSYKELEKLL